MQPFDGGVGRRGGGGDGAQAKEARGDGSRFDGGAGRGEEVTSGRSCGEPPVMRGAAAFTGGPSFLASTRDVAHEGEADDNPRRTTRAQQRPDLASAGANHQTDRIVGRCCSRRPHRRLAGRTQADASTADAARYLAGLPGWVAPVEVVADIGIMVVLWAMVGLAISAPVRGRHPGALDRGHAVERIARGWGVIDVSQEAVSGADGRAILTRNSPRTPMDPTAMGSDDILLLMGTFVFACGWLESTP